MNNRKLISIIGFFTGIIMIAVGIIILDDNSFPFIGIGIVFVALSFRYFIINRVNMTEKKDDTEQ